MTTPTQEESLQLSVSNFGPIAKAEIDLRPLTVFVGPSNTGKSYLAILIYALHRFFDRYNGKANIGIRSRLLPISLRNISATHIFDDDNVNRLVAWLNSVYERESVKRSSARSLVQLPDSIASMVYPLFSDLDDYGRIIADEIMRSFGIADTRRLIRYNNRDGAKINLMFKPFEYEIKLNRREPRGAVSLSSEEAPLYIDPHIRGIQNTLFWINEVLTAPVSEDSNRRRRNVEYLLGTFFGMVLSNVVNPLTNAVHYLPADRAGVMHAHRTVVSALIERASHAGLQRDTLVPTLSGVLADFLEQLIEFGEPRRRRNNQPRRRRNNKGDLATRLEQQILRGEIRIESSEAGYPMFFYQPQGWRGEDLPLMNTSSMVSELAPVVLYLRYIVQPGDVLIIEEPESHLHPAMQVEFVRQLAAVVNSGIRVMLTTHSEWVLDELTNLVRLSDLPKRRRDGIASADFALNPDEVGVWLFEPKQRPRGSVVKEIRFDEEFGGFRSGFDEVAMGTYNDYAKISNRIERRSAHDESH